MRRSVLSLLAIAFLVQAVDNRTRAENILFMHNPVNPDLDEFLAEWMETLGHEVEFYDTSLVTDPDEQVDLALAADLVFVAESLGSASTSDGEETYIKEVPTPQIWAEAYAWDDAAMTGDFQFEDFGNTQRADPAEDPIEELIDGQTEIFITNPDHPMAAGLSGAVRVYEEEYSVNWGLIETMGKGVDVIATLTPAAEYAALFVYDEGAELEDGTNAPEARIGLYLGQAGLGAPLFDNITTDGLSLIEAAINYALNPAPTLPGDYNGNQELDAGDLDLQSQAIQDGDLSFDENGDGAVNFADRELWVHDFKNTWIGDSNLDLEFNSGDLVAVFTAGKFEVDDTASWSEGDWNGDMRFGSGDLVVAFQDGGFEQGPRGGAAAVPEPCSAVLLLLGILGTARIRRR